MAYSNILFKVSICNFVKKCNISNSNEQKYILQMSAFDVYVYLKREKLK